MPTERKDWWYRLHCPHCEQDFEAEGPSSACLAGLTCPTCGAADWQLMRSDVLQTPPETRALLKRLAKQYKL